MAVVLSAACGDDVPIKERPKPAPVVEWVIVAPGLFRFIDKETKTACYTGETRVSSPSCVRLWPDSVR